MERRNTSHLGITFARVEAVLLDKIETSLKLKSFEKLKYVLTTRRDCYGHQGPQDAACNVKFCGCMLPWFKYRLGLSHCSFFQQKVIFKPCVYLVHFLVI